MCYNQAFFALSQILAFIDYLCDYFLHKIGDLSSKIKCRYVYKLESSYYPCTVPIFRMKSLKKQKNVIKYDDST